MRNLLIVFFAFFAFACTNEIENSETGFLLNKNFDIEKLIGSEVAYLLENEVVVGIDNEKLLMAFNKFSNKVDMGITAVSYEKIEIDGNFYLRFHNDDDSVSTVALIELENTSSNPTTLLAVGGTVCTTTACANCCGCIPKGSYCSSCNLDIHDCKRTTSSLDPID